MLVSRFFIDYLYADDTHCLQAIRDGVIEARVDHDHGFMQSKVGTVCLSPVVFTSSYLAIVETFSSLHLSYVILHFELLTIFSNGLPSYHTALYLTNFLYAKGECLVL